MPSYPRSLASVRDLNLNQVHKIIEQAFQFKRNGFANAINKVAINGNAAPVVLLAFFEPSTRTRTSFEIAALRLGLHPVHFSADHSTSLKKGESLHESLANLLAMQPDLLVCRHGGDEKLASRLKQVSIPFINAGDGKGEHPTQALLDAMTIIEKKGRIAGERIVFVGDVEHSRVANSGLQIFKMLGAEVAVAGPAEWRPKNAAWRECKSFANLQQAAEWASVCIGLRIQKERHSSHTAEDYIYGYRLDKKNLAGLNSNGLIMHPGPFVPEEDLSEEILDDPRCVVHQQVTNGVYVRAAVMAEMLAII